MCAEVPDERAHERVVHALEVVVVERRHEGERPLARLLEGRWAARRSRGTVSHIAVRYACQARTGSGQAGLAPHLDHLAH